MIEQFRPFPPPDLIDQAEEEEAIRLAPAVELKEWVLKTFNLGWPAAQSGP